MPAATDVPAAVAAEAAALFGPAPLHWDPRSGPFTGIVAAVAHSGGQPVGFAKWAPPGAADAAAALNRERHAAAWLADTLPSRRPRLLADPAATVGLWFEALTDDPDSRYDDPVTIGAAAEVLDELAASAPPKTTFAESRLCDPTWLLAVAADIAPELLEDLRRYRDDVRGAADVTCHADTHPGNWVLSPTGPILVDVELLCHGPAGWDRAQLVAFADLDDGWRAALAADGVGAARARACVAALAAKETFHTTNPNPAIHLPARRYAALHLRLWRALGGGA